MSPFKLPAGLVRFLIAFAVVIAALSVLWFAVRYFNEPTSLRIATGPDGSLDARMIGALDRTLTTHRAGIRLHAQTTSGYEENYRLLEKGEVELAILRGDQGLPGESMVVMILRKNLAVIVAPSRHELESLAQLKGKRLGIVARSGLDEPAIAKLLAFHGLQKSDVTTSVIKPDQVGPLTDSGRLDAVVVVGTITDPEVSAVVYAIDRKKKTGPSILAVDLADLAETNSLTATSETIPKNAFPRRKVPDDEVDTIAVPTVIAGAKAEGPLRQKVRTQAIEELARNLVERKVELSQKLGTVVAIEAPDSEKGARLPVHPGTAAYLDSTDTSWYTLFSDQIWTVWLIGGALCSVVAAFFTRMRASGEDAMLTLLDRLRTITQRAKAKPAPEELDRLSSDLSDIAMELATLGYQHKGEQAEFSAVQLAFDNARFVVETARSARKVRESAREPV